MVAMSISSDRSARTCSRALDPCALKSRTARVDTSSVRFNVKTRLLGWLVLATMPVIAAGAIVVNQLEKSLEVSVEEDLANLLQLEVSGGGGGGGAS